MRVRVCVCVFKFMYVAWFLLIYFVSIPLTHKHAHTFQQFKLADKWATISICFCIPLSNDDSICQNVFFVFVSLLFYHSLSLHQKQMLCTRNFMIKLVVCSPTPIDCRWNSVNKHIHTVAHSHKHTLGHKPNEKNEIKNQHSKSVATAINININTNIHTHTL